MHSWKSEGGTRLGWAWRFEWCWLEWTKKRQENIFRETAWWGDWLWKRNTLVNLRGAKWSEYWGTTTYNK